MFNAPWPAVVLVALIVGGYALQVLLGPGLEAFDRFGFRPTDLARLRLWGLVTDLFVHGGWIHAAGNALWALPFGAAVSRLFGLDIKGAAAFLFFFLVCGVAANLGYAALHIDSDMPLVGASGAVAGLMGAGSRLMRSGPGGLAPLTAPMVVWMAASWMVVNVVLGVLGVAPGMGQVLVAWEAHIFGYAAGVLLIGPAARILGRPA